MRRDVQSRRVLRITSHQRVTAAATEGVLCGCVCVCACSVNHFLLFSSVPVFIGTAPTPFNIQTTCQCSVLLSFPPFLSSSSPHCHLPLLTYLQLPLLQLSPFIVSDHSPCSPFSFFHPSYTLPSLIAIFVSSCPSLCFLFSNTFLLRKYWMNGGRQRKSKSFERGRFCEIKGITKIPETSK